MNPCPCGFVGERDSRCQCSFAQIASYRQRLSGPLLDRFDLRVELPAVPWSEMDAARSTIESSAVVRERVAAARARQLARQGSLNAELEGQELRRLAYPTSPSGRRLLSRAVGRLRLSVRAASRLLKLARTVADLEGADLVETRHLAEALHLRVPERSETIRDHLRNY